jgi:tetratricopeptide (TPR) repeat protein
MKFRKEDPFEPVSQISTRGRAGALEWEEAALSNPDHEQEVFDKERLSPAFLWVRLVLLAVFAVLLFRVFSLQVVQGSYFRKMSENNRIRSQTLLAPRGLVYDRNGQILVQNSVSYNLAAVPFDIRPEALDSQLNNLVQLFGLDKAEAERKIKAAHSKSLDPVILRNDLSQDQAVLFETRSEEFAGFVMNKVPVRQYLNPEAYAHVLGYTGVINSEERQKLDKDLYDNNDFVGKSGIELMYEHALHGNNGQVLVEVDAMGHLLNLLGEKSPKPGQAIELNLDNGLQIELYNALKSRNKNVKAAAVALHDDKKNESLSNDLVEEAIYASDKAIAISPNNVNFWKTRNRVFYTLSQLDPKYLNDSLAAIETAIALSPTDPKVRYNRALILNSLKEKDEALSEISKAIELKPDYRDAYITKALLLVQYDEKEKAREVVAEIFKKFDPNDSDAKKILEEISK